MSFAGETAFPKNHFFRRIQLLRVHQFLYTLRDRIDRFFPAIETRMPAGPHQPIEQKIVPVMMFVGGVYGKVEEAMGRYVEIFKGAIYDPRTNQG
jgi:hypothetical protein